MFALSLSVASLAALAADSVPAEPRFAISRIQVEGNSLLPAGTIDSVVGSFTGADRSFADIEAARRALEARYLVAGHSTVRVILPEQEIGAGTVRLVVQEMRLGSVEVTGARHHDIENVRATVPALVEGRVPDTVAVADSLRLANENPSKQTYVLLKPDPAGQRVDALLRVDDEKPWKAFATVDNTGTRQTGHTRLGIGYQHANLFNRDHVATVQYITSGEKPGDVKIYGFGYRVPLYGFADAVDVYGGHSDVNSGTVAGLFNVSGKGSIAGVRYTHNLTKTSALEHRLAAGLDYRAYGNSVMFGDSQFGADVTVHPVNLSWSGLWRGDSARIGGYATWLDNLPGGDKGGDADFSAVRAGAVANYQIFRFGTDASVQLPGDWQARVAADVQQAHQPLVPGEQFGIGGQDSVRGFDVRSVSGDRGWRGSLEIYTPDLGGMTAIADARLRLCAFHDAGRTHRIDARPGETIDEGIASTGIGMRLGIGKSLSVRLDYGYVLDGAGTVDRGNSKLHGSIAYVF